MAEIEPVRDPAEAPVETAPVEATSVATAPAEAAPVAIGDSAAAGPPPARPKGLLRWGVALLALAVMVGVVSVALAVLASGTATSSVQGWLPKDTIGYLELRADLPGDQRAKVGDLLAKFPGFKDQATLDAKIDAALDRLLDQSGATWTTDIKPWLAGEIAVAVTPAIFTTVPASGLTGPDLGTVASSSIPADGFVALVALKDAGAAKAWISRQSDGAQTTETYDGGEIVMYGGRGAVKAAWAIRGNVLLVGPEKGVKAALDTKGKSSVGTSAAFAAARKTAPDAYLGFGYFDMKAFMDAALATVPDRSAPSFACLEDSLAAIPGWMSGALRAEDDAIVLSAATPLVAGQRTVKDAASTVAAHLPKSTVVSVAVREFGPSLVAGMDAIEKQLGCDPATADMIKQVVQALDMVGGIDGLLGWAGDTAIVVTADGTTWGGGLAAVATDEKAAGRALDQLKGLLKLAGSSVGLTTREESYGGATLVVLTIPPSAGMGIPDLAATVADGVVAIGTIDFVRAVVDTKAGSSLASADRYRRAIEQAGGNGSMDMFVDIAGLRAAVESMLPAEARGATYDTETRPFLEPFEAVALVGKTAGEMSVMRMVVTFTK